MPKEKEGYTTFSVPIDKNLHKKFKLACVTQDINMKDISEKLFSTAIKKFITESSNLIESIARQEQDI